MRLGHVCLDSSQALAKQGVLEGTLMCNLKFDKHCVLDKKTKVKFGIVIHRSGGLLDYVHVDVWDPTKTASFEGHQYFVSFIDDSSRQVWVYPMRQG